MSEEPTTSVSEATPVLSTAARFSGSLVKLGIVLVIVAIVLHLLGLTGPAGMVGWLAVIAGGIGIVLAGVASSSPG